MAPIPPSNLTNNSFATAESGASATVASSSNDGIFMRHLLTVRVSANETLCEPTLSWDFLYGLIFSSPSISPLGDTASPFSRRTFPTDCERMTIERLTLWM